MELGNKSGKPITWWVIMLLHFFLLRMKHGTPNTNSQSTALINQRKVLCIFFNSNPQTAKKNNLVQYDNLNDFFKNTAWEINHFRAQSYQNSLDFMIRHWRALGLKRSLTPKSNIFRCSRNFWIQRVTLICWWCLFLENWTIKLLVVIQ